MSMLGKPYSCIVFIYGHCSIAACVEDFLKAASEIIPNFAGIKFSSKDLVDMIGCVHVKAPNRDEGRYNLMYGCDEVFLPVYLYFFHVKSSYRLKVSVSM